ncbi:MAG: hypothetical protein ABW126_08010 [Candidatus Sedimenticola sp. 4PFRAG1]
MDPVSVIFASYLDLVTNIAHKSYADVIGTEVTALSVEHKGITVPYSYNLWRIRDKTVCASYKYETAQHSKCTMAASSLFSDICQHLQSQSLDHWKKKKLKNMYCNAAATYQPTVANIQWSSDSSGLQVARANCNSAIAELLGTDDPALRKKKEKVCSEYKKLMQEAKK